MFGRIGYTWEVTGASWRVLKKDKELLIFPILSDIACLLVLATFAVPTYLADAWQMPERGEPASEQIVFYGLIFLFYYCNFFVITFFNSAIVGPAVMHLNGREPTFGDALIAAMNRLPQIATCAFVAATFSVVLKIIESRSERVGQFVIAILGTAWTVMTFLVVPVLVVEGIGPIDAFKRSNKLLVKTWGQQLFGNSSFGIIFFLLSLPATAYIAGGFALGGPAIGISTVVLAAVYLLVLGVVQSMLQAIFQAAIYIYASEGHEPAGFDHGLLSNAMVHR